MSDWQPIETAPQDGRNIWLKSEHPRGTKTEQIASWWSGQRCADRIGGEAEDYQDGWYYALADGDEQDNDFCHPTHWRPTGNGQTTAAVVYLREVDAGTDNACWVVCAKGDAGAVRFSNAQP